MLYVSGMATIVRKAGTAISSLSHSMKRRDEAISTPTIIKAAAVTSSVTTAKRGEKNRAVKKHPAVTTEVKPERPPAATPEEDSM